MDRILGSVGRSGDNRSADVLLVQKLLNAWELPDAAVPLDEDGKIGKKTLSRIEAFQKHIVHMFHPDGLIEPAGKTFKKLSERPGARAADKFSFSQKAIELLKSIERLATKPYDDQSGRQISDWVSGATIGYGHLISADEWHKYKNGISEAAAVELFKVDLKPYVMTVRDKVTASVTQNEFDAMVIFAFNIGSNAFSNSSALKLVNDPTANTAYLSLEEAWKAWNKSQGIINQGLINRRQAEWNIYSKNLYQGW